MNKKTTYARVVRKIQSGGAQWTKKSRTKAEPSDRARASKKQKSELDEALKSDKIEGTYDVVPPMTLNEIIDEMLKEELEECSYILWKMWW